MEKISISHMGISHNYWLRALAFYMAEITLQEEHLKKIAAEYISKKIQDQASYYELQLKGLQSAINKLCQDIHKDIAGVARQAADKQTVYVDDASVLKYAYLEKAFVDEEQRFNKLRHQISKFAARYL